MFNTKKHKRLISKISKNIYFRYLTNTTKDHLCDIDNYINNQNVGFLWEHQYNLLLNVLKVYKIFDNIKKNKNLIKINENLIDYINFDSVELNFNLKLNLIKKIEKDTKESYNILYLYEIKKIKD